MYRAFLLYGELRCIDRLPREEAAERLDAWLAWASRWRLKPFIKLAGPIRKHKHGVMAAIGLQISNGRLEALNRKVRLLSHYRRAPEAATPLHCNVGHRGSDPQPRASPRGADPATLADRGGKRVRGPRSCCVLSTVLANARRWWWHSWFRVSHLVGALCRDLARHDQAGRSGRPGLPAGGQHDGRSGG
jgi:Transposase